MKNYKGQEENLTGSVGTAKEVTEILEVFKLFLNK
jgi:hypothetical protein